jgi:hypothetical protein
LLFGEVRHEKAQNKQQNPNPNVSGISWCGATASSPLHTKSLPVQIEKPKHSSMRHIHSRLQKLTALILLASTDAFVVKLAFKNSYARCTSTHMYMGLLDSISSFLHDREGDFVKLEDSEGSFGPGPLLLLYNVPEEIEENEFMDMVSDGAPQATKQGVIIASISSSDDKLLEMTLADALEQVVKGGVDTSEPVFDETKCPVLFFSGFRNDEMMQTYNIVGKEIYEEAGGSLTPACAKAVEKAMDKPLRQVLEEISGDHKDAMSAD